MPNPTLREIVETFTEEELSLTVPIEFQDVSADDYPYVNEYNRLLASAQTNADTDEGYDAFVAANEYRTVNQEHIDKYVLDAKKLNILMTLVINAYMFAKGEKSATNTSYDNSTSGASSTNVQDVIDECFQSVSSGKALVASAITDKRVPTDADATFETMANNINAIKLGSGTAIPSDVKAGKTFTNSDGVEYTGTYDFVSETSASATAAELTKGYTAWVNGKKITGTAVLVSASTGYILLNSSDTSAGNEITGGWSPSGTFRAEKNQTATVQSNNLIDLTNISHIDFTYRFDNLANDGDLGSSYCSFYLLNTSGTASNTVTCNVSSKGIGTFSASINTSSLKGSYRIGYKLYTYYTSTDKGSWTEYDGAYANITRIALF